MKHVYTLSDLQDPSLKSSLATAKLAVIGNPIKHSASPPMHQAALDAAGKNIQYIRVEVEPNEVDQAFTLMEQLGFIGCNVTVPHKLEAMNLCDELTDDAVALGATNTILFKDGKRIGHNTDGPGLSLAIQEDFGSPLSEMRTLILGAGGGAGRAIATQCAREGSSAIFLSNRTVEKVETLAQSLTKTYSAKSVEALSNKATELADASKQVDLIINSTSLGLKSDDELPIDSSAITSSHNVYDAIYNPPETALLKSTKELGANYANGLSMLLHQGALAYRFWFKEEPAIELMKEALEQAVYPEKG